MDELEGLCGVRDVEGDDDGVCVIHEVGGMGRGEVLPLAVAVEPLASRAAELSGGAVEIFE